VPELPEVETVRRGLQRLLEGELIEGVDVRETRLRYPVDARRLRRELPGRRVTGLGRRAKYLLIRLEEDGSREEAFLVIHLGMSGRIYFSEPGETPQLHTHVIFSISGDRELHFCDPRRFGLVDLVPAALLEEDKRFSNLGVEPLSDECSAEYFFERSRKLRQPVKNFLMDGRRVVGVGNIYASEALFLAGVHPQRAAGRVSLKSWERITAVVKEVLTEAIRQGGTTLNDFQGPDGTAGYFQVFLRVYGRGGEECRECSSIIRRKVLSGRSTFYCPRCQH
jgi:formamidopyrimidine-DNA glycosylase